MQSQIFSVADLSNSNWGLNPKVFAQLTEIFGMPQIDLFAQHANRKLERFFLLARKRESESLDALAQSWDFQLGVCVPVNFSHSKSPLEVTEIPLSGVILVAPWWPKWTWFTEIQARAICPPWHLPLHSDILYQGPVLYPNPRLFCLTAWLFRGAS